MNKPDYIALNLTTNLTNTNHCQHLVDGIEHVSPCDACAIFLLDKVGFLKPIAIKGISSTVLERRLYPKHHPRLQAIMETKEPVRFDANARYPFHIKGMLTSSGDF